MAGVGIDVAALSMGWPDAKRQRMISLTIEEAQQQLAVRLVHYVELEVAPVPAGGWEEHYHEGTIRSTADIARAPSQTPVHTPRPPALFSFTHTHIPQPS